MPRFNVVTECNACGNPSEGRYCPDCITDRNASIDRQRASARLAEEQYNGEASRG